jgi:LysM repeat protein
MAKKKTNKNLKKTKPASPAPKKSQTGSKYSVSNLNLHESYVSLFLGIIVVVIIAAVLFSFLIARRNHPFSNLENMRASLQMQLAGQKASPMPSVKKNSDNQVYVTKAGDSLWDIAERRYGDGNKWIDIARINNITDSNDIFSGNKLNLPDLPSENAPNVKSYTVKDGDNLWTIAVDVYGDGFRFIDIARANDISTPDSISSGQVLILP